MLDRPTAYHLIIDKINEIIDYLNEQEEKTCKVIWTHQDSRTGGENGQR